MPKGNFYETKGAKFVTLKGYRIVERNFRTRFGEIDIIAQNRKYRCFIEVKARRYKHLVSGLEAVNAYKMEKIKKAGQYYALRNPNQFYRFDLLEIIQGRLWRQYNLIEAAFDMNTDVHG
jgi:putative endonuclease